MPFYYDIFPELNLLIYIGFGTCTGHDFFATADQADLDERRKRGMKVMIDVTSAQLEVGMRDVWHVIEHGRKVAAANVGFDENVVITHDHGLKFLSDTLALLSEDTRQAVGIFYTSDDAIFHLGLKNFHSEIIACWQELKKRVAKEHSDEVRPQTFAHAG